MDYEKIMRKHGIRLAACLLLCFLLLMFFIRASAIHGQYMNIQSGRSFDKVTMRTELAVVMFYEKDKKLMRKDKALRDYVKRLEYTFSSMSRVPQYKEAGVHFLAVNCAQSDLGALAHRYNIKQLPTVLLFEDGKLVQKKRYAEPDEQPIHTADRENMVAADIDFKEPGDTLAMDKMSAADMQERSKRAAMEKEQYADSRPRPAAIIGNFSYEVLRHFIDDYFGSRIDDIMEDKAEARRIAAQRRLYYGPYWGWGWGAYYPYWRGYPGYYGYYGWGW